MTSAGSDAQIIINRSIQKAPRNLPATTLRMIAARVRKRFVDN